jgi:NAD(P)-dependent dehydrogenase (short-subunit alcohol dehydrogenase family)
VSDTSAGDRALTLLEGRKAAVTDASSGIGKATVDLLFRRHHRETLVVVLEQHEPLHVLVEW